MVHRWSLLLVVGCGAALFFVQGGAGADKEAARAKPGAASPASPEDQARHFQNHIAPLLSRHCLECHDSTVKKAKLDLSGKDSAFKGGKSGPAIVIGDPGKSLIWEQVKADEMPPGKRPKLSDEEKQALRQWLEQGAVWSGNRVDPLAHVRAASANQQWLRRLTVPEYIETVRAAVGVDIAQEARRILPPDLRADGFSNTAYNLNVDLGHVEAYARLAEIIVQRMDAAALAAQHAKCRKLDDACMREVIAGVGKWLLRGPLEEFEVAAFARVSKAVADEGGDFNEAVSYVVEAMLQSPRFIYRIENQRGDGSPRQVTNHELASRMSYILWGGPPDKKLMRAADAGELMDPARAAAQVDRMLNDPRTIKRSLRFVHEWLDLDRLDNLRPAKDRFPNWDPQLAADMREETLAFFEDVVWKQKRPLSELLNAQVTFVTPRLAAHYGLKTDGSADPNEAPPPRASQIPGLLALYRFDEGGGDTVHDVSGVGSPLNLKIDNVKAVAWGKGQLTVTGGTLIATSAPPQRLVYALKRSKALTIEASVTPAATNQTGPARIVTLSKDSGERNFTLGQDGDKYDVRLRTTQTSINGMPSLSSPAEAVKKRRTHVVYTRDAAGKVKLFVDGKQVAAMDGVGDLGNWRLDFRMALANELSNDRPWLGTFHRVAIYGRALSPQEIRSLHEGVMRIDLSATPSRGGLLTQGSTLTIGGDDASMVTRGLFILHDLLHSTVGSAPPGVDTTPVPTRPGQSQRTVAESRLKNESCTACHSRFEPLAFALERFDGLGAYHEVDEHGNKLREDGRILIPGEDKPIEYRTAGQLMDVLAASDRVKRTMTRKVAQFALGRPLVEADEPALDQIHEAAQKNGATYSSLIKAIVMSDLVRMTRTETKP